MFIVIKILLAAAAVFQTSGSPIFQGISFQRGFEINFKPLDRKPITFFREKWSPFGVFGKKFAIQKRSLDNMVPRPPERVPRPAAPVFEHIEEIEHIGPGPLLILPKPVVQPPVPPVPAPIEPPKPPPPPPVPLVSSPKPSPPPPPPLLSAPMPIMINGLPPMPEESNGFPPISTNMVIIQPTKLIKGHGPSHSGLYTDITHLELVKEHSNSVKPLPPPIEPKPPAHLPIPAPALHIPKPPEAPIPLLPAAPIPPPPVALIPPPPVAPIPPPPVAPIPTPVESVPPPPAPVPPPHPIPIKEEKEEEPLPPIPAEIPKTEIFLKDSSLIRGSKMALQFGTVFLTLMAQFFDNARASIDLMTNPPPKFKQ